MHAFKSFFKKKFPNINNYGLLQHSLDSKFYLLMLTLFRKDKNYEISSTVKHTIHSIFFSRKRNQRGKVTLNQIKKIHICLHACQILRKLMLNNFLR